MKTGLFGGTGVYVQVYFTCTFSFLEGFRSERHTYRLLQNLEHKGFLKVVDEGGGRGKQRSWTLGERLQNVSYWSEKTLYNGSCPEDGDLSFEFSKSESCRIENKKQSKSNSNSIESIIDPGERVTIPVNLEPGGDPEDWSPKDWATFWANMYCPSPIFHPPI